MSRVLSISGLKQRKFKVLDFEDTWLDYFGEPQRNFRATFYGPSGSGKSTLVLEFADYLANHFGKVLYNSHEEGFSKSLQRRCNSVGVSATKLYFADRMPLAEMIEKLKKGRYAVAIIDSIQYMGFNYGDYKGLAEACPTKALIFISQVNQSGKTKGGSDILHACDIKVQVVHGKGHIISRYGRNTQTVTLFETGRKSMQTKLF
jgi:hypothetical protein